MELACNLEFYNLAQFLIPYVIAYSETDYPESKRFRTIDTIVSGGQEFKHDFAKDLQLKIFHMIAAFSNYNCGVNCLRYSHNC